MGVAHLGDRLHGGRPIQGAWPKTAELDKDQREEIQKRLAGLGYLYGRADGKLGSKTREAVRNSSSGAACSPMATPMLRS